MKVKIENWSKKRGTIELDKELQPLEFLSIVVNGINYGLQEHEGELKIYTDGQLMIVPHAANSITLSVK